MTIADNTYLCHRQVTSVCSLCYENAVYLYQLVNGDTVAKKEAEFLK